MISKCTSPTDGVEFDVVILSNPRHGDTIRELLDRYVPRRAVIDHAKTRFRGPLSVPDEVRRILSASTS